MSGKANKKRELTNRIRREVQWIGIKPYSHNIIGITLQQIDKEFGRDHAISVMKRYKLDQKGWAIPNG